MGNSSSTLPYSIDDQVGCDENGWNIHRGTKKSDGAPVTVFLGKKPTLVTTQADKTGRNRGLMQLNPALHHFQRCKRFRHPHILDVYATLDTDNPDSENTTTSISSSVDPKTGAGDLIIVTEPCVTLLSWLQTNPPTEEQLAWGLQSMVQALHFLHSSAKLAHGCVCPASFYVNRAGDIKLWNFSLTTPIGNNVGPDQHFRDYDAILCPPTYRAQERVEQRWEAIQAAGVHAIDSYSLGILIANYYEAAGHKAVPTQLQKAVQRLQTPNVRMRPRLQPLLKCPVFTSPYQTLQSQISEVSVQPVEQKVSFWLNLAQQMNSTGSNNSGLVDQNMAVYKLLPLIQISIQTICTNEAMMSQDLYRREVLAVLTPLFFIAETYLTEDSFAKELKPLIGLLFTVKDRGVRGALLQKMTLLTTNLDANSLNGKVFEPMCSGFSDSSPALREMTLKSTLGLVPHLTAPNLEKLTRYLVRLQADTEVSIRTNTIIFIAKLAPHLTQMAREKMILPAFVRALRDTFAPCRLAALQCTVGTFDFFDPQGLAGKLLPSITPHLLDPDVSVRKEAFKVSEALFMKLRTESDKMTANEQGQQANEQPQISKDGVDSAPGGGSLVTEETSSSSYLAGFTSWMASSAQVAGVVEIQLRQSQLLPAAGVNGAAGHAGALADATPRGNLPSADTPLRTNSRSAVKTNDGWGDDEDGVDGSGDDDLDVSAGTALEDPFASIGMKTGAKALLKVTSPSTSGVKKSMAVQKLAVDDEEEISDGWDDF